MELYSPQANQHFRVKLGEGHDESYPAPRRVSEIIKARLNEALKLIESDLEDESPRLGHYAFDKKDRDECRDALCDLVPDYMGTDFLDASREVL